MSRAAGPIIMNAGDEEPIAILNDPLAEAPDIERALQALLDQKSLGQALPAAAVAAAVSVAERAAHGTLLREWCADVLQGVDVDAAASAGRSKKRPRLLVDAVTHGP